MIKLLNIVHLLYSVILTKKFQPNISVSYKLHWFGSKLKKLFKRIMISIL